MVRPSLLGSGSQQFRSFIQKAQLQFESQMIFLDTLIADCQEATQVGCKLLQFENSVYVNQLCTLCFL
jgi:hypothetical protein